MLNLLKKMDSTVKQDYTRKLQIIKEGYVTLQNNWKKAGE